MNDIDYKSTCESLKAELATAERSRDTLKTSLSTVRTERNTLKEAVDAIELKLEHNEFDRNHKRQELANARRLFMELYQENRTLALRFDWLETAATDAVNACEKHEAENMDRLRDELGLEMRGD